MNTNQQNQIGRRHAVGLSVSVKTLIGLLAVVAAASVQAANDTWNGAAGDATFAWTNKNNWVGAVAPVATDNLFFDGATGLVNSNAFAAGTAFNGVVFNAGAGAFQLGGNGFNLGGNITNLSANLQTITNDMTVTINNLNFDVGAAGLTVGRATASATRTITKLGSGTLTMTSGTDNSFMSGNANAGTMVLAKKAPTGTGTHSWNALTINSGAIVKYDPNNLVQDSLTYPQIGNFGGQVNGTLVINAGGTLDLNGTPASGSGANNTIIRNSPTGTGGLITNSTTTPSRITLNSSTAGQTLAWSGNISDNPSGTITVQFENQATTYMWSGTNSVNGGLVLDRSTLFLLAPWLGVGATTIGNGTGSGTLIVSNTFNDVGGITLNSGTGARGTILVTNTGVISGGGTITVNAGENFVVGSGGSVADGTMSLTGTLFGTGTNNAITTVNGGGNVQPGGVNAAGTLTTGNLTDNGTLTFDLTGATTIGAGVNDLLAINGNLDGSGTVTINPIGALVVGTPYTIIQYTGTYTPGTLNPAVVNSSRYAITMDDTDTTGKTIKVTATGSSANLAWNALIGANNTWNIGTGGNANWTNLTSAVASDFFYSGDSVNFDDNTPGVTNIITIGTGLAVVPSVITNNAATNNYVIVGPGKISGAAALVKQGTNTLTINSVNDFTGSVSVQGGLLALGSGALGGGKNAVSVSAGAILSLGGTNVGNGAVVSIDSLAGAGTVDYLRTNAGVSAITFSVGNNNGSGVFSGSITNSKIFNSGTASTSFTNTIALIKTGTGTETLSGTNTYAGQTTINGGGVLVAAAISDTAGASSISTNTVNLNKGTLEYSGAANVTTVRPFAGTAGTTNGIQVDNAGATLTVLGVVNNMTLQKLGAGTLSFGGVNNNSALTMDVQAGALVLNKTNAGNQITGIANVSSGVTLQLAGNNNDQISDNGSVASMNGTFDLNGRNETIQALSGAGTVRNNAGSTASTLTLGSNSGSGSFLGTIANGAGTVAVTKTGNGTATLTTNTYTGITTISGGTLGVGANGSLASSAISLAAGTKLDVSAISGGLALSGSQTLSGSGVVTGSVSTASGTVITVAAIGTVGTLSFSNNLALTSAVLNFDLSTNTTPGGGTNDLIQLAGGTLTLSGVTTVYVSGTLSSGNYTLIQGASGITGGPGNFVLGTTLRQAVSFDTTSVPGSVLLVVGAGTPASLVWAGTNSSAWDVQTTADWLNGGTPDVFFNSDNVAFNDNSTNGTVNVNGTVSPSSTYVTNNARAYTIGSGVIASGTVTKDGPGLLTLNGANTYAGATLVQGGTLILGNNSALGTTVAGTTATNGGAVDLNAFSPSGEQISVAGTGSGNGALVNNGASASAIGTLTLTSDATVGGSANISASDFTTTASVLTKTGANTLTLNSGATRGVGVLVVNQGVVSNAATALQVTTTNASGQAIVMKGSTALNGTQAQLTRTNGTTIKFDGTGGIAGATISAPLQLNNINIAGSNTVDMVDVDHIVGVTNELTINGVISQSGAGTTSITKIGAGTLVLGAANTFGGATRITNGIIRLANTNALQNSTLDLNAADVGSLDFGALTSATFGGLTGTRNLVLTNVSGAAIALTVGNNNVSSVSSNVISGPGSLTKAGSGTFQMTGVNTYTGKTFVSAGTLQVAADSNLGAAPGAFVADQLTLNGGTLSVTNSASFAATRGLTVGGGGINAGSGVSLVWGGPIAGTGLTSSGLGTLILAGTNTYTTTAINNGGILQVGNGGASGTLGSGAVTIAGGSTLVFKRSDSTVVSNNVNGGLMVFNSGTVTFANSVDNNGTTATVNTNATLILNVTPGGPHVVGGGNIALTLNGGTAILGSSGGDQIFNQKGIQMNNGTFDLAGTNETIGGLIGYGSVTNSQANINPNATLSLAINAAGTPGRDGSLDIMNGILSINGCIINVAGNATVEAGAGLAGNGAINILFGSTFNNFGTLTPGNGNTIGSLLISNAVSCNLLDQPGSTNRLKLNKAAGTNDQIAVVGNITFDGTLIVTNVAGSFVGGESYQLFMGSIGGTFANVILPALPGGLSWDTSALYTTGTISVSGSLPSTPTIGSVSVSGSNLTLSGTGGTPGGPYDVISSTNVALPLASWTSILTTNFDGSGNFSATLPYSSSVPQSFYILKVP